MKLKLKDLNHSDKFGYIFISLLKDKAQAREIYNTIDNPNDNSELDIKINVNGVELNVEEVFQKLYDCIVHNATEIAKDKFKKYVNDRITNIVDKLEDIAREVDIISEKIPWNKL